MEARREQTVNRSSSTATSHRSALLPDVQPGRIGPEGPPVDPALPDVGGVAGQTGPTGQLELQILR